LVPFFRVRVVGRDNVPRRGGLLLAANHFSFVDPLVLGTFLPRRLWFVMAEDQFKKPVNHAFGRLMDVIPIKAGAAFKLAPIRKCLTLLKHGRSVAIFPEGQRSKTGSLLPAMPGLGVLAARSGAPILPVAIAGTREAYPVGQKFPRPGKVTLFVGQALKPAAGTPADEIAQKAMAAIADLLRSNGHGDYLGPDSELLVPEEDVRESE
jgi:1-acyl-sn-glycerol-3-phosphate acyltransferase